MRSLEQPKGQIKIPGTRKCHMISYFYQVSIAPVIPVIRLISSTVTIKPSDLKGQVHMVGNPPDSDFDDDSEVILLNLMMSLMSIKIM